MEELLALLKDGHSRSVEMLAAELNTSTEDILRRIDFLEHAGLIRRINFEDSSCSSKSCTGCSSGNGKCKNKSCSSCQPKGGFKHMGQMWEVI
ncbi:MAG: Lrp/AsnC family transcriptional regulator [Treponemataceae bacterium]|nr:Lrp/AsnC family transcriptional regulator [Treponemataceae bacterium]